jgi:hypothetical protein
MSWSTVLAFSGDHRASISWKQIGMMYVAVNAPRQSFIFLIPAKSRSHLTSGAAAPA